VLLQEPVNLEVLLRGGLLPQLSLHLGALLRQGQRDELAGRVAGGGAKAAEHERMVADLAATLLQCVQQTVQQHGGGRHCRGGGSGSSSGSDSDSGFGTPLGLGVHSTATGAADTNAALGSAFNTGGASNVEDGGGSRSGARRARRAQRSDADAQRENLARLLVEADGGGGGGGGGEQQLGLTAALVEVVRLFVELDREAPAADGALTPRTPRGGLGAAAFLPHSRARAAVAAMATLQSCCSLHCPGVLNAMAQAAGGTLLPLLGRALSPSLQRPPPSFAAQPASSVRSLLEQHWHCRTHALQLLRCLARCRRCRSAILDCDQPGPASGRHGVLNALIAVIVDAHAPPALARAGFAFLGVASGEFARAEAPRRRGSGGGEGEGEGEGKADGGGGDGEHALRSGRACELALLALERCALEVPGAHAAAVMHTQVGPQLLLPHTNRQSRRHAPPLPAAARAVRAVAGQGPAAPPRAAADGGGRGGLSGLPGHLHPRGERGARRGEPGRRHRARRLAGGHAPCLRRRAQPRAARGAAHGARGPHRGRARGEGGGRLRGPLRRGGGHGVRVLPAAGAAGQRGRGALA
jgi:hypothetical protein